MSMLTVEVPDILHQRLQELAVREGVSVDEIVSHSITEKLSALLTEEYLSARASRGSRAKYLESLAKVSNGPVDDRDEPFPGRE